MTIDDAILALQNAKKLGARNIIIAWWEAELFPHSNNRPRKDDNDWASACQTVEDNMDWSRTWEDIQLTLNKRGQVRKKLKS